MYGKPAAVSAKVDRATRLIAALIRDVDATLDGVQGRPFAIVTKVEHGLPHTFELTPRWDFADDLRWGVIVGEIIHDLRSALEHLVWQLVEIGNGQPDHHHTFPLYERPESCDSFRERACRPATWPDGTHGPLFGIPDDAVSVIEACQPYHRADTLMLAELHAWWNTDKHQALVPVALLAAPLKLITRNVKEVAPSVVSLNFGQRSMVVSVALTATGPDPHADLATSGRVDLTLLADGSSVIDRLLNTARFISTAVVHPLRARFSVL